MASELESLEQQHRLRSLRTSELLPNGRVRLNGREMLNLCSNDYLGLADQIKTPELGAGAGGSQLVCGHHPQLIELEQTLCEMHRCEASIVFGSGFLANVGCLSALTGRGDVIFSDKLNHASIIDGAMLSRAEHVRYRHCDMEHLEQLLQRHSDRKRKLIVSDAVFSMDGDCAPLETLVELKHRYGAMLMLDEAHSGGVFGPRGAGLAAERGVAQDVDIHMGTLSKAYGCYGAYVCGSRLLIDYLVNRARSLIYSTALPPALAAAATQAVQLAADADDRRRQLQVNADLFRNGLCGLGLNTGTSSTQIVPLVIGSDHDVLRVSENLRDRQIAAVAIRPPTVPENGARIRFSVMATHRPEDLEGTVDAIQTAIAP